MFMNMFILNDYFYIIVMIYLERFYWNNWVKVMIKVLKNYKL